MKRGGPSEKTSLQTGERGITRESEIGRKGGPKASVESPVYQPGFGQRTGGEKGRKKKFILKKENEGVKKDEFEIVLG